METQLTRINGKVDAVSDETVMMGILSLIHTRKQTIRLQLCAATSESYGGSSRPHFENPWAGLSRENYSSPTSGLAANQVSKPTGLSISTLSSENVHQDTTLPSTDQPWLLICSVNHRFIALHVLFKKIIIYFYWRITASPYCAGFLHTLTWISHRCKLHVLLYTCMLLTLFSLDADMIDMEIDL